MSKASSKKKAKAKTKPKTTRAASSKKADKPEAKGPSSKKAGAKRAGSTKADSKKASKQASSDKAAPTVVEVDARPPETEGQALQAAPDSRAEPEAPESAAPERALEEAAPETTEAQPAEHASVPAAPAQDAPETAAAEDEGSAAFALEHPASPDGTVEDTVEDAIEDTIEDAVADLLPVIEAVVFAADKPIAAQQLRRLTGSALPQVKEAITALQSKYDGGVELAEVSGGYQFRTRASQASWVRKLVAGKPQRLTRAMLEALAIVAYRQPITRPEVDEIRGVDCGGTLRVLLERNLIRIVGKKEEVGRPLLYGTTKYFLEFFQLKDLKGLPTLRAFAELSAEHRQQVEDRFAPAEPVAGDDTNAGPADAAAAEQSGDAPGAAGGDSAAAPEQAASATPSATALNPSEPAVDNSEEDEELLSVLDRALEKADSVLKQKKKDEAEQATASEGEQSTSAPPPASSANQPSDAT